MFGPGKGRNRADRAVHFEHEATVSYEPDATRCQTSPEGAKGQARRYREQEDRDAEMV